MLSLMISLQLGLGKVRGLASIRLAPGSTMKEHEDYTCRKADESAPSEQGPFRPCSTDHAKNDISFANFTGHITRL